MQPRVWGPPTWKLLHGLAAIVHASDTRRRKLVRTWWRFVDVLKYVLPCSLCRESLTRFQATDTGLQHLKDTSSPFQYMYALHNLVNEKLHKGSGPSIDQLRTSVQVMNTLGTTYFSHGDLVLVLTIFGACADALSSTGASSGECTKRRKHFARFARHLATLLQHTGMATVAARLAQVFSRSKSLTLTISISEKLAFVLQIPLTNINQAAQQTLVRHDVPDPDIIMDDDENDKSSMTSNTLLGGVVLHHRHDHDHGHGHVRRSVSPLKFRVRRL